MAIKDANYTIDKDFGPQYTCEEKVASFQRHIRLSISPWLSQSLFLLAHSRHLRFGGSDSI